MDASFLLWLNAAGIVSCRITVRGQRSEISTGCKIPADKWDKESKRMKGNSPKVKAINDKLELMVAKLRTLENELIRQEKAYTSVTLKELYEGNHSTAKKFIETYQLQLKWMRDQPAEDRIQERTMVNYVNYYNHTKKFILFRFKQEDIPLTMVDEELMEEFRVWLISEYYFQTVHVSRHLHAIQRVMRFAVRKRFITHSPVQEVKVKTINYAEREIVYLTEQQLLALENYHSDNRLLQQVADVAIFQAHTALAWQEVFNLSPDWIYRGIDGTNWISFVRQKTKRFKRIPTKVKLDEVAQRILDKYSTDPRCLKKGKCLPVASGQVCNLKLKIIAAALGLPEQLSTHHLRKTAGMLWLNGGMREEVVAALMGDRVEIVRRHYARIIEQSITYEMNKYAERKQQEKLK